MKKNKPVQITVSIRMEIVRLVKVRSYKRIPLGKVEKVKSYLRKA